MQITPFEVQRIERILRVLNFMRIKLHFYIQSLFVVTLQFLEQRLQRLRGVA